MKKIFTLFALMAACVFGAQAAEKEIYAAMDGTTMKLYYDANKGAQIHLLNGWSADNGVGSVSADALGTITDAELDVSMQNALPTSTYRWFKGMENLQEIRNLDYLNTSEVTNMNSMFSMCGKLTWVDVSSFDISKVEDMSQMFYCNTELKTIYCTSNWSKTTATSENMFNLCSSLVGGNSTSYANAGVKNASYARPDDPDNDQPGYFTVPKKVYTEFDAANSTLTYYYDELYSSRNGAVEFYATPIRWTEYHNQIKKVKVDASMQNAPLTSFNKMFYGGYDSSTSTYYNLSDAESITGLENLNTENVTDMSMMFNKCHALKSVDLRTFKTGNVNRMSEMFAECNALSSLDLTSFNMDNMQVTQRMFFKCTSLTTIYCNKDWGNNNKLTNSWQMFSNCTSLVGGNNTACDGTNNIDKIYARPDGGPESATPGYFTLKPVDKSELVAILADMQKLYTYANSTLKMDDSILADYVTAMMQTFAVMDNSDATQEEVDAAVSNAKLAFKDVVSKIKQEMKKALTQLLQEDDSDACKKIVEDAKPAVDELEWDDTKSAADNITALQAAYLTIYSNTSNALAAQRIAEAKTKLNGIVTEMQALYDFADAQLADKTMLDALGTAITTADGVAKNDAATLSALTDAASAAQTALNTAIEALCDTYRKEKKAELEGLLEEGYSSKCWQIVDAAKDYIVGMVRWDNKKSVNENTSVWSARYTDIYNNTASALDAQRKADKIADARKELGNVIDDMNDDKLMLGYVEDAESYKIINDALTAAQAVYDKSDATAQELKDAAAAAQAERDKVATVLYMARFEYTKAAMLMSLDALLLPFDSEACRQLVEEAKARIKAITYKSYMTYDENLDLLGGEVFKLYEPLKAALEAQRAKDTATGIEEVEGQSVEGQKSKVESESQKLWRNGQLLIIRNGRTYNAHGQLIIEN